MLLTGLAGKIFRLYRSIYYAKRISLQMGMGLGVFARSIVALASDTNRFNRDTGLPPMQLLGIQNRIKQVKFKYLL